MLWRFGLTLSQKGLRIEGPGGAHELGEMSQSGHFHGLGYPLGPIFLIFWGESINFARKCFRKRETFFWRFEATQLVQKGSAITYAFFTE